MEGPTYHPTSPFSSHVRRTVGLICATNFVPGGANGVAAKSNSPYIYVYAESLGFDRADLSKLSVILHCSMSLSHSERGRKLGLTVARPALE